MIRHDVDWEVEGFQDIEVKVKWVKAEHLMRRSEQASTSTRQHFRHLLQIPGAYQDHACMLSIRSKNVQNPASSVIITQT